MRANHDIHDISPIVLAAVALGACFACGCALGSLIGWLARSIWR